MRGNVVIMMCFIFKINFYCSYYSFVLVRKYFILLVVYDDYLFLVELRIDSC